MSVFKISIGNFEIVFDSVEEKQAYIREEAKYTFDQLERYYGAILPSDRKKAAEEVKKARMEFYKMKRSSPKESTLSKV